MIIVSRVCPSSMLRVSWCEWCSMSLLFDYTCVFANRPVVHCGSAFEPGASGLPYYCTSICVRFGCTRLASCVDSTPKNKTELNSTELHHCRERSFQSKTNKQHSCVWGPLRECRSIRSGASGLPYYCTPLVCISAVIGLLTVWRHYKTKPKNHPLSHGLTAAWHFGGWIPNPGALPIIASVSLAPIPCLFAYFYAYVSCVYAFFSICLYGCVASAACFVFGSVFIATFLFLVFLRIQ